MKRIIVIGCPGSGKSTFSGELHRLTNIPLFHLDMLYWNPDRTKVEKSIFVDRLLRIMQLDEWIIDGNYGSTMELRLKHCDTVFFLDYPLDVCLAGIRSRRSKPRPDMPWIEEEDDPEFIEFINNYDSVSKPKVMALLDNYPSKDIYIFKSRNEADEFLKQL